MSKKHDQKRFTILEVAASEQWTRCAACRHTTPQSATRGVHPIACKLLLIAPIHEGMARLSWHGWLVTYEMVYLSPTDGHPSKY